MRYKLNKKIRIDSDTYIIIRKETHTHLGITFDYYVALIESDEYGNERTEDWAYTAKWPGAIEVAAEYYNEYMQRNYG